MILEKCERIRDLEREASIKRNEADMLKLEVEAEVGKPYEEFLSGMRQMFGIPEPRRRGDLGERGY